MVALLAASLGLAPGGAADSGAGCPADKIWTTARKTCEFGMKGFPITFTGAVTMASGTSNSIRVWVSPRNQPTVVLAECSRAGQPMPSCNGGIPDSSTVLDVFRQGIERPALQCNVQSTGTQGTFYCHSGSKQ